MKKLTKQQKENIIKKVKEDQPLPDEYRFLIPFETEREYELTYASKERKEDILADTLSVPFQPIKKFGEVKENEWHNMLIFGENLQALKHLLKLKDQGKLRNPDGRDGIKLIYIDPPFGTGDIYDARGDVPAYSAKLQGSQFLEFLRKRLIFLKEVLSEDGIIFVRIDYHFGHYIKALIDEIFGKENFKNEIVITRTKGKKKINDAFSHMNDSLFFYSLSNKKLNEISEYTQKFKIINKIINNFRSDVISKDIFKDVLYESLWVNLGHRPGERISKKERIIMGKSFSPPKGRHWIKSQEKLEQLLSEGKLRLICSDCGNKKYKGNWTRCEKCNKNNPKIQILLDSEILADNWTDIAGYSQGTGYPTENSEDLLDRVIRTASNEGDIVLDCFAGSGTTGAVAEKLGRKWTMIDSSKLAIYTIQKRMLNLKTEIGNKGKPLKPKPFVLYNAGLYLDSGFIEKMEEEDYKKFVLELFGAEPVDNKIKGVQMHGILNNRPVMVFSQKDFLTYEFIDDLHKTIGNGLKDEMYIIVPQSVVRFSEDYRDKGKIRYHILKVPYSIIQKILEKNFIRGLQPLSKANINQTIESVGFDFIYSPKLECEYYQSKEGGLFDQLVIKIKKFEPVQISKKPVEFKDSKKEALSMVMIDKDYDGKVFDMDQYFFGDEIVKNDFKVAFPKEKAGQKLMIIYLDVLGNEKVEVKNIKDFKKK